MNKRIFILEASNYFATFLLKLILKEKIVW